jgi:hypothetical protein
VIAVANIDGPAISSTGLGVSGLGDGPGPDDRGPGPSYQVFNVGRSYISWRTANLPW